ncbi:MAG: UDP-3-O-acyl-N-acetylglucosamine deacetylase [Cyanophyceae cyanobacterium]
MQQTLQSSFTLSGVGLHGGLKTKVRVVPASVDEGRYFVRVDLPGTPAIPARPQAVCQTTLSTELAQGNAKVRTVEHLLAALGAMGIDNARIEIDGPEVPLLDGSAREWVAAIAAAGIALQNQAIRRLRLTTPLWICQEEAFVAALPAPETRFTYGIDFPYAAIGNQWHSWSPSSGDFATEIAPARTFGFAEQIEALRARGLIKGGSLENALVCDRTGWLNPPLRFVNEPVRHKLLDLMGDLSLLGRFPQAHFLGYRASHQLHVQLDQLMQAQLQAPLNV